MVGLSLLVFSYLLGSIPFGFVVAYLAKGIDIRNFGSGNIGATNVLRVVGKKWGILVFVLDFFKGFLPLLIAKAIGDLPNLIVILAAVSVVCGHNWTIFLKFKGGKGVATSVGAICGLSLMFPALWAALLIALTVWMGFFYGLRYVSLASLVSGAGFFISTLCFALPLEIKIFALVLFILIIIRHKKNILNLLVKKENRF
jgi:glycerol-3-phosphate acyltransferase PlsY